MELDRIDLGVRRFDVVFVVRVVLSSTASRARRVRSGGRSASGQPRRRSLSPSQ
jgi:hypothetical protein